MANTLDWLRPPESMLFQWFFGAFYANGVWSSPIEPDYYTKRAKELRKSWPEYYTAEKIQKIIAWVKTLKLPTGVHSQIIRGL